MYVRISLLFVSSRVSPRSNVSSAKSQSTSQFVTALVFNSAVFGIEVAIFTFARPYFRAIYEPRSYIPPESCVPFLVSLPHLKVSSPDCPDQETRPASVPKYLRLAACDMEG